MLKVNQVFLNLKQQHKWAYVEILEYLESILR